MNNEKKRIRSRTRKTQRLRIKTSLSLLVFTGSSVLLITACFLIYLNFSKVEPSSAGINHDRIIPAARTQTEMDVKTPLITQPEQQPASRGQDIINKRSAVGGTTPDLH